MRNGECVMKDFLILCAKIGLGLVIGFTLIYGSSDSLRQKAEDINDNASSSISTLKFE